MDLAVKKGLFIKILYNLLIVKILLMVKGNLYKNVYSGLVMNNLINKMLAV